MDINEVYGVKILADLLMVAVSGGLIERDHAKGVFKKALDGSGLNTPKPEPRKKTEEEVKKNGIT